MSKSSLSSVVSNLVRASMGTSVTPSITDEDLDRHVAELILKEAKQKAESYGRLGIKAYLPTAPDPNAPRPNKRFLTSIIKSTDDHNKTILRAQALAAQEIKREKDERERRERRDRAEEAAAAERMRRDGRRDYDGHNWDSRRERDRRRDRERDGEKAMRWDKHHKDDTDDDSSYRDSGERRSKRRHHSRSPSKERDRDRKHRKSHRRSPSPDDHHQRRRHRRRDDDHSRKRRHHTRRSASPRRTESPAQPVPDITASRKRERSASPSDSDHRKTKQRRSSRRNTPSPSRSSQTSPDEEAVTTADIRPSGKGKAKAVDEFRSPSRHTRTPSPSPRRTRRAVTPSGSSYTVRSPSSSPPPLPPAQLPSKMDKYFEDSYDPRFDVATLTVPNVPATGLVSDAEFAGWDAMLELIRQRREDKAEKKRLERLGISKDQTKKKGVESGVADRWASGGDSIMDIEYKKRGTVREWDLGKEGF
ncbi:hypothetical protein AZE42_03260 [Rhizopogon vesiculosus]|uniref:Pre-mRNA-splicing factor 38B n=1 Tax=Rhizopogon vesiculosus TaxID=180088 RepID=A0A1J8QEV9_9AGAM|nr:hypothetical protein AZE42_03260 [Rhizopogon vesiculosus]